MQSILYFVFEINYENALFFVFKEKKSVFEYADIGCKTYFYFKYIQKKYFVFCVSERSQKYLTEYFKYNFQKYFAF